MTSATALNPQRSTLNPSTTMFHRIIYEDWQLIFPVMALVVASCIYVVAGWRAARMKPAQSKRLAQMPLENP